MTPGEFLEEPLGGPGVRGGQSEENLSLPLKVPLSAPLPLWYGPRPERSEEEAEDPTGRALSGNWDMYPGWLPAFAGDAGSFGVRTWACSRRRALWTSGRRLRRVSRLWCYCGRLGRSGRNDGRRWGEGSTW